MSASLVGSEMCIRDSTSHSRAYRHMVAHSQRTCHDGDLQTGAMNITTVSYTHLTLPTICSV
eukprot:11503182-Alexandrium_andersonii.AAC.1